MLKGLLRFIRGSLGTAVTWAMAWAAGGFVLFGVIFAVNVDLSTFWTAAPFLTIGSGCSGFVAGGVFSGVLATVFRRRQLPELSVTRLAIWGAAAGLVLPAWFFAGGVYAGMHLDLGFVATVAAVMGGFGALTAGGTIGAAQANERALTGGGDIGRLERADA